MSYLEDSDEELEFQNFFAGKEGIVFLIDATEPMFDCQQFSLAIQCVENVMKNKAIASPDDHLAVILFGTEEASNEESFENIYVFQSLQKTSAETVLNLKELNEFPSKFGHNNRFSLAEVFSLVAEEFNKCKTKFASKRVILFTNTSDPYSDQSCGESKQMRKIALIRSQTLSNYNIGFDLIPLTSKDIPFDINAFYGEAFPHLLEDKCDTLTKLEPLLQRIYSRFHRQRQIVNIPFIFGSVGQPDGDNPEVKISINVYNLYSVATKPISVPINSTDLTKVKSKTVFQTQNLEEELYPKEVSKERVTKSYNFGEHSIVLTTEDIKRVSQFEEPALTLLGFKPRSAILEHIHLKPGHFIFPDESTISGSSVLFNALLNRCSVRDKIPICRLTLKQGRPPRLVALYPQLENKSLGKSAGFHVMYLPFKEDVRELDISSAHQMPIREEALDFAKNIVNNLTFNFEAKDFPNPIIQNHWRVIEGLALNQTIEEFDDSQTQPNYEDIETKAGYDMYSLNQVLGAYNVEPIPKKPAPQVPENMSFLVQQNKLGILTVVQLREFCRLNKIECGTRKADYMEAIRAFFKK